MNFKEVTYGYVIEKEDGYYKSSITIDGNTFNQFSFYLPEMESSIQLLFTKYLQSKPTYLHEALIVQDKMYQVEREMFTDRIHEFEVDFIMSKQLGINIQIDYLKMIGGDITSLENEYRRLSCDLYELEYLYGPTYVPKYLVNSTI